VLVPEGITGHNPAHALGEDVAKAKQLLADAGYPDGAGFPEFTITTYSKTEAEIAQQMWQENLGVTSQVSFLDGKSFGEWERARATEPYDISYTGWYTDYEDPINWYIEALANDYRNTHYTNPEFLRLANEGANELDLEKRAQLFDQADAILEDDAPTVPLYTPTLTWLQKPYLTNLQTTRTLGVYIIGEALMNQ
jgi:oligopeptide transport system substrate-binding protein